MGIWKTSLTLRIRVESRTDMDMYAKREMRTLGNLGEVLIEWALSQLQKKGSTEKLLNRPVPIPRKRQDDPTNQRRQT